MSKLFSNLKEKAPVIFLVFLCFTLFFYKLGKVALWDESEALYTEIARQIVVTKDWIVLHFNGKPWFIHPPLFMWLTAIVSKIFGWAEITPRIVSAFFVALTTFLTYKFGKMSYGRYAGFLSSVIFLSSLQIIANARVGVMDSALMFFISLCLFLYYEFFETKNYYFHFLFFISAGLGTLTKGPIALVFPLVVIILHSLATKKPDFFNFKGLFFGLVVYFLIILPWYLAVYFQYGQLFIKYILGYQTFGRFFGAVENQKGQWYYYLIVLLIGFFPWTGFLPLVLGSSLQKNSNARDYLYILWILFAFVFFSFAGTKLPNYINVIYVPLSILLAKSFLDIESNKNKVLFGISIVLEVLICLLLAFSILYIYYSGILKEYSNSVNVLLPISAIVFIGAMSMLALLKSKKRYLLPFLISVMMVFFVLYVVQKLLPEAEKYNPIKELSLVLNKNVRSNDKIGIYNQQRIASIAFYTKQHIFWINSKDELMSFLKNGNGEHYLLFSNSEIKNLNRYAKVDLLNERNGFVIAKIKIKNR